MIFLLSFLLFASFLEGALMPVSLVLLVIISRSFISYDRLNFWFAFWFGLLLSFLLGYPLGSLSLVYMVTVLIVYLVKKTHLASNLAVLLPFSLILLLLNQAARNFLDKSSLNAALILWETFALLPIYFVVRVWEERFVPKKDVKLKVRE